MNFGKAEAGVGVWMKIKMSSAHGLVYTYMRRNKAGEQNYDLDFQGFSDWRTCRANKDIRPASDFFEPNHKTRRGDISRAINTTCSRGARLFQIQISYYWLHVMEEKSREIEET